MTKILELAKQAGFYIPQNPVLPEDQKQLDRINEFARLIIDECMMVVQQKTFEHRVPNVFFRVNDIIVNHFEDDDE